MTMIRTLSSSSTSSCFFRYQQQQHEILRNVSSWYSYSTAVKTKTKGTITIVTTRKKACSNVVHTVPSDFHHYRVLPRFLFYHNNQSQKQQQQQQQQQQQFQYQRQQRLLFHTTATTKDNSNDDNVKPTIAVIGTGAVGTYYGSRLWETHKYNVKFYVRSKEYYETCVKDGFNITSVDGNITIPSNQLQVYNSIKDIGKVDWIIVSLKSTALSSIPELIYPLIDSNRTRILAIMNGLIEEDLIEQLQSYHDNQLLQQQQQQQEQQLQQNEEKENIDDETTIVANTTTLDTNFDTTNETLTNSTSNSNNFNACAGVYGGMALVCINRLGPGRVDHSYGGLLSGGIAASSSSTTIRNKKKQEEHNNTNNNSADQQHQEAYEMLWEPTKVDIVYEPSILAGRWRKNVWNLPFNGISVAMGGITVDKIVTDPGLRKLANLIMDETITVANADIIRYEKQHRQQQNNNNIEELLLGDKDKKQMMDLSDGMGPYKTSTMIDFKKKNPMEVYYLFRKPLEKAYQLNIHVPHLQTIVTQIEAFQRFYKLF